MAVHSPSNFDQPWTARDDIRIREVKAIVTAPQGIPLVVVKIDTTEPGLYGLGCATFTQRWKAVQTFVDEHLARLLVGRYPGDIGDLTRLASYSGYWRGGPVTNNAISGIDQALWDIAGKRAGMPVYELLGGKVRAAADTYIHASGKTIEDTIDHAQKLIAQGWRHVRLQVSTPGGGGYGAPQVPTLYPDSPYRNGWSARDSLRTTPELFAEARQALPDNIELLHDVHSRLTPKEAVLLARSLEPYGLFFLEDVLPPEHWDRLPEVRAASPVPLAVGELTTSMSDTCDRMKSTPPSRIRRTASPKDVVSSPTASGTGDAARTSGSRSHSSGASTSSRKNSRCGSSDRASSTASFGVSLECTSCSSSMLSGSACRASANSSGVVRR